MKGKIKNKLHLNAAFSARLISNSIGITVLLLILWAGWFTFTTINNAIGDIQTTSTLQQKVAWESFSKKEFHEVISLIQRKKILAESIQWETIPNIFIFRGQDQNTNFPPQQNSLDESPQSPRDIDIIF